MIIAELPLLPWEKVVIWQQKHSHAVLRWNAFIRFIECRLILLSNIAMSGSSSAWSCRASAAWKFAAVVARTSWVAAVAVLQAVPTFRSYLGFKRRAIHGNTHVTQQLELDYSNHLITLRWINQTIPAIACLRHSGADQQKNILGLQMITAIHWKAKKN